MNYWLKSKHCKCSPKDKFQFDLMRAFSEENNDKQTQFYVCNHVKIVSEFELK